MAKQPNRPAAFKVRDLIAAENLRTIHAVRPEQGYTRADLVDPRVWVHVAYKLRPGDVIEVRPLDSTYYAEMIVLEVVDNVGVKVRELHYTDLCAINQAGNVEKPGGDLQIGDVVVFWGGPRGKWCVKGGEKMTTMSSKHENKDSAIEWAENHNAAMA